ncbi:hypothetical protein GCM10009001_36130 [Virgibacillus siamensis]|uniref:Uncharacterized protein n=1 Tax=Virgibacillus siamensis TaxID=480071 RepID=A0ABN1GPH8_9BACI
MKKTPRLTSGFGQYDSEDLVMKHLGEDITYEAFWEKVLKMCIEAAGYLYSCEELN